MRPFPVIALLACTLMPFAAGGASAEESGEALEVEASAMPMPPMPPALDYDGGTAIINFVAPVSDNTMAELARAVQNAVIGGAEAVRINISSQGGSLYAVQFAVNIIRNQPVPVETVAMSGIASAAIALFCAGEKRYMADGATLYLHQPWSIKEIQDKTAAAVVRGHRLTSRWYEDVIHDCTGRDADHALLDYSSRDVVVDLEQATELGMVNAPLSELQDTKVWGSVRNVVVPDNPFGSRFSMMPSYQ